MITDIISANDTLFNIMFKDIIFDHHFQLSVNIDFKNIYFYRVEREHSINMREE